jgi:formylglycine-generating enzyme required for sulfatase activity
MFSTLLATAALIQTPEFFVEEFPKHLTSLKMVKIPGKDLYVSATEVPWEVFDIWVLQQDMTEEERNSKRPETLSRPSRPYAVIFTGFGHHEYPAICMSINSSNEFCKWLSKQTGKKYRLPTKAEWQLFAGAEPANKDETSWHWNNSDDTTHKVATKKPNEFGLYDVYGNVAEWTQEKDGSHGVAGGSWKTDPANLKPTLWDAFSPKWNEADPQNPKSKWWLANGQFIGLRIVCTK